MKRIFLGTAVAAMAMLSACETILPQEPVVPEVNVAPEEAEKTQIFTATLGVDTKVYLDYNADQNVYKTLWNENDCIYVCNPETREYETCMLVEGAGTATAKFAGSIEAETYVAVYGNLYDLTEDGPIIRFNWEQGYTKFWDESTYEEKTRFYDNAFPMVAKSSTKDFAFQNVGSILKLNITGDGEYFRNMSIKTNDDHIYLAGNVKVTFGEEDIQTEMLDDYNKNQYQYYYCWQSLSDTPLEVYVVLPAQTYKGGLSFMLETESSVMEFSVPDDIEMKRSHIRNLNLTYEPTSWKEPDVEVVVWTPSGETYPMTFENGYMVARDLTLGDGFLLYNMTYGHYWGISNEYYYYFQFAPMNTALYMVDYPGNDMYTILGANAPVDLYVDVYKSHCFVMSAGATPDDLPTKEEVLGWSYSSLYWNAYDGEVVKVQGRVVARTTKGFVMALDRQSDNAIYVYDGEDLLSDVQVNDYLDLYADKTTYRGLAELTYVNNGHNWYRRLGTYNNTFAETPTIITSEFDYFDSTETDYVGFVGTLEQNGSYYNVYVDGASVIGSIHYPVQDLQEYFGKKVYLEGYYLGRNTSKAGDTYINIALTKISDIDTEGSTNDVLPGDDIIVTR